MDVAIKYDLGNPSGGTVSIHNLNKDTERALEKTPEKFIVEAGYGDQAAMIFSGAVQRVEKFREQLERIVKVNITGETIAEEKLGGFDSFSFSGTRTVRAIVQSVIENGLMQRAGPLDLIPESKTITDWADYGQVTGILNRLLLKYGIVWYEDEDGVIQLSMPRVRAATAAQHRISELNGLIESPAVTEDGVRIKSLLNPAYKLEDVITVESEYVNGNYKIVTVQHTGSNWDGDFRTELDTRPV